MVEDYVFDEFEKFAAAPYRARMEVQEALTAIFKRHGK